MQETIMFFLLALVSEFIGTVSGFGSSVFFVPLAGMIFDFQTTLALTGVLHIFSTSSQIFMFRKHIDKRLMLLIGLPSVLMVIVGAWLNDKVSLRYAELVMGLFLIAFGITFLSFKKLKFNPTKFNAIVGGATAGFLAGLIGTGGAIRGASLAAFDLHKNVFVATSAGIDLAVDLSRTVIYLYNGYLKPEYYWYVPVLFVMAICGTWIGKRTLNILPQDVFKKITLCIILGVGVFMLYNFIAGSQIIR